MLGVTEPKCAVKDSSLLSKRQGLGFSRWRVSKQIPRGPGKTKCPDIGAGFMSSVVFGFALG
jgi:hypothetical protein